MNFEESKKALLQLNLTTDDTKSFEKRGNLATQFADSIDKIVQFMKSDTKDVGNRKLTYLSYREVDNPANTANLTLAYDTQNIFLSSDETRSLKDLGIGNEGREALVHLVKFKIDKIVPTGHFGYKFSKACEALEITMEDYDEDRENLPWNAIRAKYNSSDDMKTLRSDAKAGDEWNEIKHIFITPVE